MTRQEPREISPGTVLEFFESKEILCGVVLAVKDGRFHVLTERNREINLTRARAIHHGATSLDLKLTRDELLKRLTAISDSRKDLMGKIDLGELWSLLEGESGEFDALEIAEFLFATPVPDNEAAALNRLLLHDRLFFQSKDSKYTPRSPEGVEQRREEMEKEEEKERSLSESALWVEAVYNRKSPPAPVRDGLIENLKEYALFGQDAPAGAFTKEVFRRAGVAPQPQSAFRILVRLGVWREDENLLLHEQSISPEFPPAVTERARRVIEANILEAARHGREDLTGLPAFTVDSVLTRDYDDALSVRELDGGVFEVGIHIADAAEFVSRDDVLDLEAEQRASSIYLPDDRISMFPASLSEGIFSLKAGADRLALSFLIKLDSNANIIEKKIVPSVIRIRRQLTYHDVDTLVAEDPGLKTLFDLALILRQRRLDRGAIILPLPEMHVHVNSAGMIQITRYDKETPSQIMVSEWMIEANAAAADYLVENGIPSIFRNQSECRPETEFVQSEHDLFRVYRQRRLFARAELAVAPKAHCSLAIPNYTTVTSPIRRYADLVVQRQLKHALAGNPALYSREDLERLITRLAAAQARIFTIQRKWTRYWVLKYLEQEDLETLSALVLDKNARFAHLLLPDMFLEANAPIPENSKFHQGEMVRIRIDKVLPREDILKIQILDTPPR
ncbi:MAG: RNB domain-containing ribonuclease [Syntrophobacteraceae bacterium]